MADIVHVNESQVPPDFLSLVRDVLAPNRGIEDVEFYLSGETPIAILMERDPEGKIIAIKPLGCSLCIRPRISRDTAGRMLISGKMGIPFSAISSDEPRSPMISMLAFCPDCHSPVFDVRSARRPLFGQMKGFRDE